MNGFTVLTISQLNRYVKSLFDENPKLKEVYIKGEISNYTNHYRTGHIYMTLKDGTAAVKAVMFSEYAKRMSFTPTEGMSVIVRASVSLFERDGSYQLYVYDMQPDGLGAVWLAFQQLKEKLAKQGLFDPAFKKPIPAYPMRIGVITSSTGAAYRDILSILGRRWPMATVVLCSATVQGDNAVPSLIASINTLNTKAECDVIILGRGGGAIEDLWCFNNESLAYAIFNSKIPIISAVGHETDYTICDFVADMRAPTPSAAAEMATPDINEIRMNLISLEEKLKKSAETKIYTQKVRLDKIKRAIYANNPNILLLQNRQNLNYLVKLLKHNYNYTLSAKQTKLVSLASALERLNPVAVLSRGYSITTHNEAPLISADSINVGDKIQTVLSMGSFTATVEEIRKGDVPNEKAANI